MKQRKRARNRSSRSWDPVAEWYTGWVGRGGSEFHRRVAIPSLLDLLEVEAGEQVLDIGCGPGVLAQHIAAAGARYTGVDSSRKLIEFARRHHSRCGEFILADAATVELKRWIDPASFDAVTFLLSIQDIAPLDRVLANVADALGPGGRLAVLMTHPCFRVPRQSGWGWDERRRLRFRRIDRYLTPLEVPMKSYPAGKGATRSHHRPLQEYVETLAKLGFVVERLREIPVTFREGDATRRTAVQAANSEIPLFLGIRARKRSGGKG